MKLWLDDSRSPPDDSWDWARSVEQAKSFLRTEQVTEQSLDHDLGYKRPDGLTLLVWELDNDLVPFQTTIHSWNDAGALRMESFLLHHRRHVAVERDPRPPRTRPEG